MCSRVAIENGGNARLAQAITSRPHTNREAERHFHSNNPGVQTTRSASLRAAPDAHRSFAPLFLRKREGDGFFRGNGLCNKISRELPLDFKEFLNLLNAEGVGNPFGSQYPESAVIPEIIL